MFEKVKFTTLKYKTSELKKQPDEVFNLPALTAGIDNQGLNNYVPSEGATILQNVISISANGANTGVTFFQSNKFTILQDAYAIDWKNNSRKFSKNSGIFIASVINSVLHGKYEWTNKANWTKVQNEKILLPTKNNQIDFDFMDSFIAELEAERIAELEAERIAELEAERIAELSAYLSVSGLDNYELSDEELKVLQDYDTVEWKEYSVTKLFKVKNTKNILARDIKPNSGTTPYLCASRENNAISSYIKHDTSLLDEGNCIFIGGKTFVVTYQENDFYSNDSHNLALYLLENKYRTENIQLFLSTCLIKGLSHKYSWGNSISNKKIQSDKIILPIKNNEINFEFLDKC